jgi:hypothetical protein
MASTDSPDTDHWNVTPRFAGSTPAGHAAAPTQPVERVARAADRGFDPDLTLGDPRLARRRLARGGDIG